MLKILALESSCDETACAIVQDGREVLSSVINTQMDEHRLYGGVVPEIASRRHTENICAVVDEALAQSGDTMETIDAIAVTTAPGLIGALLVGVNYAKGLAFATKKPLIPVHHIRGHIASNYIAHPDLKPPFMCLIVSGGHTHIVEVKDYTSFNIIGRTRDDAVGEAFDKAARSMGFPYPGGIHIDKNARLGTLGNYVLPKPKVANPYDFSFSGLKTAVINLIHNSEQKGLPVNVQDLSADFQKTVCDILTKKFLMAIQEYGYKTAVICGGVSANRGVRQTLQSACEKDGIMLYMPPLSLCGDNAAMIGSQAFYEYQSGHQASMNLNASASMSIDSDFIS